MSEKRKSRIGVPTCIHGVSAYNECLKCDAELNNDSDKDLESQSYSDGGEVVHAAFSLSNEIPCPHCGKIFTLFKGKVEPET